jgi:hypothetical protein
MRSRSILCAAAALTALAAAAPAAQQTTAGQTQTQAPPPPPKPSPFPGAISAGTKTADPAAATQKAAPTIAELGNAQVMPNAEFLESFDAGRGQQYLLYGTNMPFDQVVTYYKAQLRGANDRELFREPPMHQFDLGRWDERTMAYPPSVVVKDYTWNGSEGYLHVTGTVERRYRTIIQIVPAPPADGR